MFYTFATKLLNVLPPEMSHSLVKMMIPYLPPPNPIEIYPRLQQRIWNKTFFNPIGLAAGLDKNASMINYLHAFGFSFIETGAITLYSQKGNPKPRIFKIKSEDAIINRMGFNNCGAQQALKNIQKMSYQGILLLNLGINKQSKNPLEDYCSLIKIFNETVDFLTLNVSSPNTPGLRDLQNYDSLKEIILQTSSLKKTAKILIKFSPDLKESQICDILNLCHNQPIDGLILSNTTLDHSSLKSKIPLSSKISGGLSGRPIFERTTAFQKEICQSLPKNIPVIAVGGIFSAQDVLHKIKNGASLVQIYTSFIYKGPAIIPTINRDLNSLLARDNIANLSDIIGANL